MCDNPQIGQLRYAPHFVPHDYDGDELRADPTNTEPLPRWDWKETDIWMCNTCGAKFYGFKEEAIEHLEEGQ